MDSYLNEYINLIGGAKRKTKYLKGGDKLFIIGIAGASGCGKTFFSNRVRDKLLVLGIDGIEVISCDNYYNSYPSAPANFNWDLPETLDLKLLAEHLDALKRGEKIQIPKYNFVTSQREGNEKELDGSKIKVIIVEGLFVLYDEELRKRFDLKVFTLLDPDICLARRLNRDVHERGRDYSSTIKQYQEHVKPSYINFIEPTKRYADIIISTSEYSDTSISLDMIGNFVMTKI